MKQHNLEGTQVLTLLGFGAAAAWLLCQASGMQNPNYLSVVGAIAAIVLALAQTTKTILQILRFSEEGCGNEDEGD